MKPAQIGGSPLPWQTSRDLARRASIDVVVRVPVAHNRGRTRWLPAVFVQVTHIAATQGVVLHGLVTPKE
ncbi:hypothetical protein FG87_22500 [Nocardia vulneris]|uniref:Uncharacterized protein n=1 Tax=Nocardia vulneris TaxID=1141657 RepID=A0ABR4ZC13_9NOCA|nr:hypothetical protein FG87_22500 [Nocardia vulneris]